MSWEVLVGDCRERLAELPAGVFNTCVTSPPYFGLRDYNMGAQIGLESTPDAFVAEMVAVFRAVRDALRDDGTLWLNLGDSYGAPSGNIFKGFNERYHGKGGAKQDATGDNAQAAASKGAYRNTRSKNLLGIPWRVALALQADGWYLRQDIIWAKPNPMPESVRDRCTKSHEYVFLLSKSPKYYFDSDAIAEPVAASTVARLAQSNLENQAGSSRVPGKTNGNMKAVGKGNAKTFRGGGAYTKSQSFDNSSGARRESHGNTPNESGLRNRRSVWTVATTPFKEAHFATYPPKLIEPCILAGAPEGGRVLDPFAGAGTTGVVADRLGRHCTMIELNPDYVAMIENRMLAGLL